MTDLLRRWIVSLETMGRMIIVISVVMMMSYLGFYDRLSDKLIYTIPLTTLIAILLIVWVFIPSILQALEMIRR